MTKMNMDHTIRAKVLQYKSDGNTLTEKRETLTKMSDGVYYVKDTDNWGHTVYPIFFEDNGVFWYTQIAHSDNQMNRPETKERLIDFRANYRAILKEKAAQNAFINTLQIEVMRRLGEDVAPLLASREAYLKQREEEDRLKAEEERRREQAEKEAEERRKVELIADGRRKLLEHKDVTEEQFELLAESVGYKLHIRTIGFMRKKVSRVTLNENGTVTIWGHKLTNANTQGITNAVYEVEKLIKQ